jgi:hypothetical protein
LLAAPPVEDTRLKLLRSSEIEELLQYECPYVASKEWAILKRLEGVFNKNRLIVREASDMISLDSKLLKKKTHQNIRGGILPTR